MFHSLTALPPTSGEIGLTILDSMVAKKAFLSSADDYHDPSVKGSERLRRRLSETLILEGPGTRRPADWKLFLENDKIKTQLAQRLLTLWGNQRAASRIAKCNTAYLVVEGRVYGFSAQGEQVRSIHLSCVWELTYS